MNPERLRAEATVREAGRCYDAPAILLTFDESNQLRRVFYLSRSLEEQQDLKQWLEERGIGLLPVESNRQGKENLEVGSFGD